MAGAGKADFLRDVPNVRIAGNEVAGRLFETALEHVAVGRHADGTVEFEGKVGGAHTAQRGQFAIRWRRIGVFGDVAQHAPQAHAGQAASAAWSGLE